MSRAAADDLFAPLERLRSQRARFSRWSSTAEARIHVRWTDDTFVILLRDDDIRVNVVPARAPQALLQYRFGADIVVSDGRSENVLPLGPTSQVCAVAVAALERVPAGPPEAVVRDGPLYAYRFGGKDVLSRTQIAVGRDGSLAGIRCGEVQLVPIAYRLHPQLGRLYTAWNDRAGARAEVLAADTYAGVTDVDWTPAPVKAAAASRSSR